VTHDKLGHAHASLQMRAESLTEENEFLETERRILGKRLAKWVFKGDFWGCGSDSGSGWVAVLDWG
jgi:hypothetical protein